MNLFRLRSYFSSLPFAATILTEKPLLALNVLSHVSLNGISAAQNLGMQSR